MADLNSITPWILGLLTMAVGWLFKTVIQLGKDVAVIQTALKFYFEGTAKGAAKVLDSPNPTPEDMRVLLRKYYQNKATDAECVELQAWLKEMVDDPKYPKSERSAAIDILSAMKAMQILTRHRGH
jgi:hypothetical protein